MALWEYSLHDVLQTFLHTRRWLREQQADADDLLADHVELQAVMAHLSSSDVKRLGSHLRERAQKLRLPEFDDSPAPEERSDLSPAQRMFLQIGREESQQPDPEWDR